LVVLFWTSILIPPQMQHVNGWVALVAVDIVFLYRRDVLFFICKKLLLENDWMTELVLLMLMAEDV
jgi:hypothetical protein